MKQSKRSFATVPLVEVLQRPGARGKKIVVKLVGKKTPYAVAVASATRRQEKDRA